MISTGKFNCQILECESTRKVYITYTNWCVNRMMQGKERTTIHLDLLQVGLTSFLVSGASDKVGRSLQVGFFWKSAIHRLQDQFSETVYRLTSWIRILKQLPSLKTQKTGKSLVKVYTGTAQVCFWIVVYTTKCYKNSILVCNRKKIYQGYLQANECLSVSAARGRLLPMDTTENVTKLMIYSGLQKQKNRQG